MYVFKEEAVFSKTEFDNIIAALEEAVKIGEQRLLSEEQINNYFHMKEKLCDTALLDEESEEVHIRLRPYEMQELMEYLITYLPESKESAFDRCLSNPDCGRRMRHEKNKVHH